MVGVVARSRGAQAMRARRDARVNSTRRPAPGTLTTTRSTTLTTTRAVSATNEQRDSNEELKWIVFARN